MMRAADVRSVASDEGAVLLIDKPVDWTSFDVVKRIRWTFGVAKAGHAGTLDPRATGLLIVCTGKKTKTMHRFIGMEKEYTGELELGIVTPSFDLETEVIERRPCGYVTRRQLDVAVRAFVGKQLQKPPMYAATKLRGKPLYRYARRGRTVERPQKEIVVTTFDIVEVKIPHVRFRIVCSKGTYIRSLVHDLGQRLGCGATLTELRRTRIGEFGVDQAMTIEALENTAARTAARTA